MSETYLAKINALISEYESQHNLIPDCAKIAMMSIAIYADECNEKFQNSDALIFSINYSSRGFGALVSLRKVVLSFLCGEGAELFFKHFGNISG